jgi:hypothetical protein
MEDIANIHAGDQAFTIVPSDTLNQQSNTPAYDVSLMGIQGGGKQYNTSDIIKDRRKVIYDVFGAGALIMGQGSGGSYNMLEGKNSQQTMYVHRDTKTITDVFEHDLIKQLLRINHIECSHEELPKIEPCEIEGLNIEDVGKLIQRFKSVNAFALTKENIIHWHKLAGFPTKHLEKYTQDELIELLESGTKGSSRAGEGLGTSGTGATQMATGGDNNLENKSVKLLNKDDINAWLSVDGKRIVIPVDEVDEWVS